MTWAATFLRTCWLKQHTFQSLQPAGPAFWNGQSKDCSLLHGQNTKCSKSSIQALNSYSTPCHFLSMIVRKRNLFLLRQAALRPWNPIRMTGWVMADWMQQKLNPNVIPNPDVKDWRVTVSILIFTTSLIDFSANDRIFSKTIETSKISNSFHIQHIVRRTENNPILKRSYISLEIEDLAALELQKAAKRCLRFIQNFPAN